MLTISCGNRSARFELTDCIELPSYLPPVPGLEIWLEDPGDNDFYCKVEYPSYTLDDKSLLLVCVREYDDSDVKEFESVIHEFVISPFWNEGDLDGLEVKPR